MVRRMLPVVLSVTAAGAVGGAVNAAHALWLLPPLDRYANLKWHVVPAGLGHGGLLAALALCAAFLTRERPLWQRLLGVLASGWVAGLVAWVPLGASTGLHAELDTVLSAIFSPFWEMGLVASIAYAGWVFGHRLHAPRLGPHLGIAVAAGVLGSAPWWVTWEGWQALRFFPLHGATWGVLVGIATWRSAQRLFQTASSEEQHRSVTALP